MEWLSFCGSIIGGVIGGLFTFLGVRYTIMYENKKTRKAEIKEADKNKPRLEIVKLSRHLLQTQSSTSNHFSCWKRYLPKFSATVLSF